LLIWTIDPTQFAANEGRPVEFPEGFALGASTHQTYTDKPSLVDRLAGRKNARPDQLAKQMGIIGVVVTATARFAHRPDNHLTV
jgi:hypothetical protein